jgi:hypothetical protein
MRKISLIALSLSAASLHAHYCYCPSNDIVFFADYAYLNRSGIREFRLVENTRNPRDPFKVLDTEDVVESFGDQSAIKGGILWDRNIDRSLEIFYTYVLPWNTTKKIRDVGVLSYPFREITPLLGFINADEVIIKYRSWLQNGELNYWIHVTPQYVNYFSFSWDMGLRYINLTEHFSLRFIHPGGNARYAVKTGNNLYGVQLGAMLEINPTDYWTWTFMVKTAAFVNQAHAHLNVADPFDANAPFSYSRKRLASTGLLEGYTQLAFHVSSFVSLHVGYQGFTLFGLALAPEQRALSKRRMTNFRTSGQIVINGFYVGANLRF